MSYRLTIPELHKVLTTGDQKTDPILQEFYRLFTIHFNTEKLKIQQQHVALMGGRRELGSQHFIIKVNFLIRVY